MVSTAANPLAATGNTPLRPGVAAAVLTTHDGRAVFELTVTYAGSALPPLFRLRCGDADMDGGRP